VNANLLYNAATAAKLCCESWYAQHVQQSGTTACIATVEPAASGSSLLTIANVGDSRALLLQRATHSTIWQAVQLTTDHKPDCDIERQRVMSKGARHL
jgi:serine/threonine protein phosphatase PrpC